MLSRFLNPKNDLTFKYLFGTEKHKNILIHFLNDVFARTTNPIEDVEFLKPIFDPEVKTLRTSIVDVLCKDLEGNKFIIEMRCVVDISFIKQAKYYASSVYISQHKNNDKDNNKDLDTYKSKYQDLKSVIFLAILDGTLFPNKKDYLSHHVILDKKTHEHDLQDFSFSFLELSKFKKQPNELVTILEKWMYFFKHASSTTDAELPIIVGSDSIIQQAYTALEEYNYSAEEINYYDYLERNEDVYRTTLSDTDRKARQEERVIAEQRVEEERVIAEQRVEETRQSERQIAEQRVEETRQSERQIAEQKLEEERQKIAKNLLATGMSIEQVAAATQLSINDIKQLVAKNINN